jgi:hypothetical protein
MMIEPPVMSSPPKAFTPSRCALESRPFVELPPPFLCAIAESPFQAVSYQLSAFSSARLGQNPWCPQTIKLKAES